MTSDFLAFLSAKKAALIKRIQRLEREVIEVDKAERLFRQSQSAPKNVSQGALDLDMDSESTPTGGEFGPQDQVAKISSGIALEVGGLTIKERVRQLLAAYPEGKTSDEILLALREGGTPELARSSLSPQLSRLKQANILDRINGRWLLVRHKTEAEGGLQPPPASNGAA